MKKILLLLLLAGFAFGANAQRFRRGGGAGQQPNLQQLKKQFFEEQLSLDAQTAPAFWKVHNAHQDAKKAIRQEMKSLKKGFNVKSDAQLDKDIDRYLELRQEELNVDKKYMAEYRKVLSVRQVAVLLQAEEQFKARVLQEIQNRRRQRMGGGFDRK